MMKNILRTSILMLCLGYVLPPTLAQITFRLELLPDQANYQVSVIPDTSWAFPFNLTSSAQVTIRVPHGTGDYRFEVENLTSIVPDTDWDNNSRIDAPPEAPVYDYLSFGLLTLGTEAYEYETGVEIPLFSFANGGVACVDSIELINNDTDPFMPPNSFSANIGNAISILGAGLINAYSQNHGTGRALCTPEVDCETSITVEDVSICRGESYQGQFINDNTTINTHYISFLGCDSLVSSNISLLEADTVEIRVVDCHAGITTSVIDTMSMVYMNMVGCDSLVITYNETMPIFDTTLEVTLLEGLLYEGVLYENDTVFTSFNTTSFGCDSTITVEITILENPTSFTNVSLCEGEPFNGEIYTENTSFIDTFPLSDGIDSFVITNLFVLPTYHDTLIIQLCDGELYENITYNQDTTWMDMYNSIQGCDSLLTTQIRVANSYESSQRFEICAGELFESIPYTQDTTFVVTYTASNGCDSIVQIELRVHPFPDASISGNTEICLGEEAELSVHPAFSYTWSDGSSSQHIVATNAGTYSVSVTNEQGCLSQDSVSLSVNQLDVSVTLQSTGCSYLANGYIAFQSTSNEPLLYSVNGGLGFSSDTLFENLVPDTYDLVAEAPNGCLWKEQRVLAEPQELLLDLGDDIEIQLGDSVSIDVLSNQSNFSTITWTPSLGLNCNNCLTPNARPMESTLFSLTVVDENGCTTTDDIQIFVDQRPNIYFPTAFSPNGDGINDLYLIYASTGVKEISTFRIFNRWGGLVFEREHFSPNDSEYGWTGDFNNKNLQSSIFSYMTEIELVNGEILLMEGQIFLMR